MPSPHRICCGFERLLVEADRDLLAYIRPTVYMDRRLPLQNCVVAEHGRQPDSSLRRPAATNDEKQEQKSR
jgi:hypothetical protein